MLLDVDLMQNPLYTVAEAARIVDVPVSTMTAWAKGYQRRRTGKPNIIGKPIVTWIEPQERGWPSIPFIGAAEALVVAAVRRRGVPLQRVRPALEVLIKEIGVDHALASQRLYTDGAEILYDYGHRRGDSEEGHAAMELVVVRSGQRVFDQVISSYLDRIDYGTDGFAELIRVPPYLHGAVVADPRRSSGAPIFSCGAARVEDALALFQAGESLEGVSLEFGVPVDHLLDVLRVTSCRAA